MNELKIESHRFKGEMAPIEAKLLVGQGEDDPLAVVLPGVGYSVKQPLLYYAIVVLLKHRFRVLAIDTVYGDIPDWTRLKSEKEARGVVERDAIEMFREIPHRFGAQPQLVLGRSLGTYALACALEHGVLNPQRVVWQTPALRDKWPVMRDCGIRGFGVIGTGDHFYEQARASMLVESIVVEGADHAMEIPGDPLRSIEILGQVTRALDEWLVT